TRYRVIGEQEGHALVELHPLTGRTHQLRVHCAHARGLGNPIVGDRLYGRPAQRLMLHAARLVFEDFDFHDDSFPPTTLAASTERGH
ncbi:MAG: RNA pseudouridine synthase, partial [Bacteroidaceae bacterium]|nr:RNA pseudouridine synthase [Bacteroidaceae bacterium]